MGSAAREAPSMARGRDTDESRCLMALLPPEIKIRILSHISTQQSLSRLAQSCGAWYGPATQELYTRDAKKHRSFAIKWMAAHAVDEQTTDSALRTLEISRRWGGQMNTVVTRCIWRLRLTGDQVLYEISTALHFAVLLGNFRLTKTLLDMKASPRIPCSNRLWQSSRSEEVLRRASYFLAFFGDYRDPPFGSAFPIFMAFLQSDVRMCKLLIEHGAGREAIHVDTDINPPVISILHFAAADPTTDYRQWQCLFDAFRKYIDEPCPRNSQSTPLHIALIVGCTQGMQIAVEYGADKEARDGASRTPLSRGALGVIPDSRLNPGTLEERMVCYRKFVALGANVNPEGDSVLLHAVRFYASRSFQCPDMKHLIYFLLEHHADIHGTIHRRNTNVANEIIKGILKYDDDHPIQESLKKLFSDLVDRGLNLKIPAPGLPSPLCLLCHREAEPEWLFDLLCEKGATIHESEVEEAFLNWCQTPRLWRMNKYDAWWQHQGQEEEMFQKWCEHPYNVWWWQHVKQISLQTVTEAYEIAFKHESRQLYDILTHLPLPALSNDSLINIASKSSQPWGWRQAVHREFEDKS